MGRPSDEPAAAQELDDVPAVAQQHGEDLRLSLVFLAVLRQKRIHALLQIVDVAFQVVFSDPRDGAQRLLVFEHDLYLAVAGTAQRPRPPIPTPGTVKPREPSAVAARELA